MRRMGDAAVMGLSRDEDADGRSLSPTPGRPRGAGGARCVGRSPLPAGARRPGVRQLPWLRPVRPPPTRRGAARTPGGPRATPHRRRPPERGSPRSVQPSGGQASARSKWRSCEEASGREAGDAPVRRVGPATGTVRPRPRSGPGMVATRAGALSTPSSRMAADRHGRAVGTLLSHVGGVWRGLGGVVCTSRRAR